MGKYARKAVEQAVAWLGFNESDGTHKKIIDVYNAHRPLARGYVVKYNDAWCATFVSAVAIKLGYTDIIPTECGCGYMRDHFIKMGAWAEDESRTPNPGDIIFYDWEDNGVGDNRGGCDHVGIVEKVSAGKITVIEGNYSNSVKRRTLSVNGRYIRGYGVPKYDKETAEKPVSKPTATTTAKDTKIDSVLEVQTWLNNNYATGLTRDGLYGSRTKAALVKALQKELGFTGKDVDGIYGPVTNAAVKKNNLRRGDKGDLVKVLQGLLVCNGYKGAYVDGSFGGGTESAVEQYQRKHDLKDDGIAGSKTFTSLCA